MTEPLTNWAGNVAFEASRLHRPATLDELRSVVAGSRQLRALGTGHSFNTVVASPGDLVSVAGLPPSVELDLETDPSRPTVTVSAGTRYGELATVLQRLGYALHNLGSLPHIGIAGACATGTHGSGDRNGNLATAVSAVELVGPEGDLAPLSRSSHPDTFAGTVVSLGALGVVTRLTLDVQPTYSVRQYVYEGLSDARLRADFDTVFAAAYSVSVFTDWQPGGVQQAWVKQRLPGTGAGSAGSPADPPAEWLGAQLATAAVHPLPGMPATYCTEQLGRPGPWHRRLPHFRLEFTPSNGDELQTEYLLPRSRAAEAFDLVADLAAALAPVLLVSEIRTVAADDLWLSPSYQRDSVALHFTWRRDEAAVRPVVATLEERLVPLGARPHWGKVFSVEPAEVAEQYPRLADFGALRAALDPAGKFGGPFVDAYAPSTS
jgi:alditol oxidase